MKTLRALYFICEMSGTSKRVFEGREENAVARTEPDANLHAASRLDNYANAGAENE